MPEPNNDLMITHSSGDRRVIIIGVPADTLSKPRGTELPIYAANDETMGWFLSAKARQVPRCYPQRYDPTYSALDWLNHFHSTSVNSVKTPIYLGYL